jgi:hypothetical protein
MPTLTIPRHCYCTLLTLTLSGVEGDAAGGAPHPRGAHRARGPQARQLRLREGLFSLTRGVHVFVYVLFVLVLFVGVDADLKPANFVFVKVFPPSHACLFILLTLRIHSTNTTTTNNIK